MYTVYCRRCGNLCGASEQLVQNFENRFTFAKVIIKRRVAYFFETQCIMCILCSAAVVDCQGPNKRVVGGYSVVT